VSWTPTSLTCTSGGTPASPTPAPLYREITEQDYRGCRGPVAAYLAPFRALGIAPPATPAVPKVRHITSWILRRPDDLDDEETAQAQANVGRLPHLDATAAHVGAFAEMLTSLGGQHLDTWMPHLHRFVTGLRRDYPAVLNGLTLSHSSEAVEGNVNRVKMIKRQMYGRAKFGLLRKRILLAA
jgi:hypothetical protein